MQKGLEERKERPPFLKVVRDVLEIPSDCHSFEITSIDWKMVEKFCDIKFKKSSLQCNNKKKWKRRFL